MKVELSNKHNDAFSASSIIGEKLLRGWTLLNASCHICKITPLIKQKNKEENFCAYCNLYIKTDKCENDEQLESNTSLENKEINKTINENHNGEKMEGIMVNPENNNIFASSNIKYIKEIKLQNEEFNEILNKNNISKNEIKNLFEYKNYIKERCGYDVGKWLKIDNNNYDEKKEDEESTNANSYIKEKKIDKNNDMFFLENKNQDFKFSKINNMNISDSQINKYNQIENELLILNKTKYALIKKLEKYSHILDNTNIKTEEFEYTNEIKKTIEILEKINNLKKNIVI
ncbi:conserved Plasmodium protein, unknown function [Plasmodium berghei]|uniref:Uncharacterized protein n=2 Tax=Plasmodium berghei TaxID=5821 RepID=A0A509ATK3_PLABA|nr:conserved Plasmodium protein, unknown function [Plasmodium berghei ANKA]SCM24537.1 conserved Plasmodium protein, unknown function [Plasmodium berghei]SCN27093.1 conserved Plasmodium protein, unknown function [Plasmodium berghei]SCO63515.1 conserved Plasmodium protein, unknown function [Plasmodium berghei]VUC56948.1 conserved Plasmodium protein, unknown function [Plasmodium berghei ANKA]|eukprot:XP_034422727.1 conserved Plasmodium protein, unknown function [Plasmodium berghei ANKA]